MSSICLCMIVRDEATVIERLIESVRGLIDTWVICDTGSVDGTQAVIERALADVPGTLHERPWRDFGHNRTELMRLAHGAADYLLLLDADMTVGRAAELPASLTADSYLIRSSGELEFWRKLLVRGDRSWRYVGTTHEYITLDEGPEAGEVTDRLDAIVIDHHADGGARAGKFERDARLLEADLRRDANNERAVFYLAQTYRDVGELEQAVSLYERRATMGGWEEEVFYSLYQAGVLRAELGDWPLAMATLVRAFEQRPARTEPLYELAARLRLRGEYETAHLFASRGLGRPVPADLLFVQPWIYRWGLLFEYSITAYWTGHTAHALSACQRLLAIPELPDTYRQQTRENRRFCEQRLLQIRKERGLAGASHTATVPRAQPDR
jgi:glycosyltransferase involved in cell wall biosynthesis